MPLNRTLKTPAPRRVRPAHPSCRGGASSVLRLAAPAAPRLPSGIDLADWLNRAAHVVLPVTGPHFDFGSSTAVAWA